MITIYDNHGNTKRKMSTPLTPSAPFIDPVLIMVTVSTLSSGPLDLRESSGYDWEFEPSVTLVGPLKIFEGSDPRWGSLRLN